MRSLIINCVPLDKPFTPQCWLPEHGDENDTHSSTGVLLFCTESYPGVKYSVQSLPGCRILQSRLLAQTGTARLVSIGSGLSTAG